VKFATGLKLVVVNVADVFTFFNVIHSAPFLISC
jgi:hypothetical protein